MPDTDASGISTAGEPQFCALQRLDPNVRLDTSISGHCRINFRKEELISLETAQVNTQIRLIEFQVLPSNTPPCSVSETWTF